MDTTIYSMESRKNKSSVSHNSTQQCKPNPTHRGLYQQVHTTLENISKPKSILAYTCIWPSKWAGLPPGQGLVLNIRARNDKVKMWLPAFVEIKHGTNSSSNQHAFCRNNLHISIGHKSGWKCIGERLIKCWVGKFVWSEKWISLIGKAIFGRLPTIDLLRKGGVSHI